MIKSSFIISLIFTLMPVCAFYWMHNDRQTELEELKIKCAQLTEKKETLSKQAEENERNVRQEPSLEMLQIRNDFLAEHISQLKKEKDTLHQYSKDR